MFQNDFRKNSNRESFYSGIYCKNMLLDLGFFYIQKIKIV